MNKFATGKACARDDWHRNGRILIPYDAVLALMGQGNRDMGSVGEGNISALDYRMQLDVWAQGDQLKTKCGATSPL